MNTVEIIGLPKRLSIQAQTGTRLSDILQQQVSGFALPCAGNHTCGKCKVKVSGAVTPLSDSERRLLSADEREQGVRLACDCAITGAATITLLQDNSTSKIIAWSKMPAFAHTEAGRGLAVDIGTTTVAMQLFDRATGQILAERLEDNAQRSYGADVISRIDACKTVGLDTLSQCIRQQLARMAAQCIADAGGEPIAESVITGNSTMLHLYEGLPPESLAVVPFTVQSYFGGLSRHTLADAPVYLPRCIGAYVGADIVCAILSADVLKDNSATQLLADIGTNGEMALVRNGKLLCCSTAAGPAFEGAGLSQGMPAMSGAIRAVSMQDDAIQYETTGGVPAKGICGSGILDVLAVMLKQESLEDTGYMEEDFAIGDSGVRITQRDVRQIQLAKSAICAGIITLLEEEKLEAAQTDRFVVAGGFGSSMNVHSACDIGLFPAALQDKTEFIGNGALGGAAMLLMNRQMRIESEKMAQQATELSLSQSAAFMDYYVDCMSFTAF